MNAKIRIEPEHLVHNNGLIFIAFLQQNRIDDIEHFYGKIVVKRRVTGEDLESVKLCPNCARQGQIYLNISKRKQKLVEKVG